MSVFHVDNRHSYYRRMFAPKYVFGSLQVGTARGDYGNSYSTSDIMKRMLNNSLAITLSGYFVSDNLSIPLFLDW